MIRLTTASFAALLVASAVAWKLGGTLGTGVFIGFLFGAGCTGLGVIFQRHILLTAPARSMQAFVIAFLGKFTALILGALAFRYLDEAAARADWRSFLISFAAAVAIILPLGSLDAIQVLRRKAGDTKRPAESEARI